MKLELKHVVFSIPDGINFVCAKTTKRRKANCKKECNTKKISPFKFAGVTENHKIKLDYDPHSKCPGITKKEYSETETIKNLKKYEKQFTKEALREFRRYLKKEEHKRDDMMEVKKWAESW